MAFGLSNRAGIRKIDLTHAQSYDIMLDLWMGALCPKHTVIITEADKQRSAESINTHSLLGDQGIEARKNIVKHIFLNSFE